MSCSGRGRVGNRLCWGAPDIKALSRIDGVGAANAVTAGQAAVIDVEAPGDGVEGVSPLHNIATSGFAYLGAVTRTERGDGLTTATAGQQ